MVYICDAKIIQLHSFELTLGNPQDRSGLGDEGRHPDHLLSEVLTKFLESPVKFTRYAFVGFGPSADLNFMNDLL